MSSYPKFDYIIGSDSSVLQPGRNADKRVQARSNLPGNIILIHGVNDVGVSYGEVEKGLCEGLGIRLGCAGQFQPANYRMPNAEDKNKLEDDPDAVFFKRQLQDIHRTPVIPFYWGFREDKNFAKSGTAPENVLHGQATDRFGNRLDKDFSKGGGPFANATTNIVDMWNRGFGSGPANAVDRLGKDPLRPVLDGPGRMYMILAAKRMAALVSMIRDYDPDEVVSIVAHSQGCLISLLAQAFLIQQGLRPADTLILTHPSYGLVDDLPFIERIGELFGGGEDAAMRSSYQNINARQTLHARLQTLVNIVQGVVEKKHTTPALTELTDHGTHRGMVGSQWKAEGERDNRGKVYLYFCPEDMTVALNAIQGIGWQGVPDYISGRRVMTDSGNRANPTEFQTRAALDELMAHNGPDRGFFQRVFTAKLRTALGSPTREPVLVGASPHDFALRLKGESAHGHADPELDTRRASTPEVDPMASKSYMGVVSKPIEMLRDGIVRVTGEPLKLPVKADLYFGGIPGTHGQREAIDPIDAAISTTSRYGLKQLWLLIDDPAGAGESVDNTSPSPNPAVYRGDVMRVPERREQIDAVLNANATGPTARREILEVYECLEHKTGVLSRRTGQLLVCAKESAEEARLRDQQTGTSARSFHSAIFGSMLNHQQVTAYDVAIGGGKASTDPFFYEYLCAVADWRLKDLNLAGDGFRSRPGILEWSKFTANFAAYYSAEEDWRRVLIEDNCKYYSIGALPRGLPVLPAGLPSIVVCETITGQRIEPLDPSKASAGSGAASANTHKSIDAPIAVDRHMGPT